MKILTMMGVAGMLGAYPQRVAMLPPRRAAKSPPLTRERALAVLRAVGVRDATFSTFSVDSDHPSLPALRKARKLGWVVLAGASPVRVTITEKGRAALAQIDSDS